MSEVEKLYQAYVQELHGHLFNTQSFEQITKDLMKSHRRKRFVAMYLIQSKEIFDSYYEQRNILQLEHLFNQIITALLHETQKSPLKQMFVEKLELAQSMISGKVTSYEIKEIEKDLHAFSFYQTKKELKKELD